MAKTKISEFSSTPGNNTDIDGINIAEGCAPSGINNAIRELMSQLKDFQAGTAGDSFNGPVGTSTAAAGAFTTLTTSSTVTHNAGTANGVAYLNGSKVLTTGSALTFDGTSLKNSASSSGATPSANGNQLVLESSGNAGLTIATGASSLGNIFFADSGDSADGFIQYDQSGRSLRFGTATAEKMRLDSVGNLGLGVTPSAWSASFRAIQVGATGSLVGRTGTTESVTLSSNYVNNAGAKYIVNGFASQYDQYDGGHRFFTAPSGTAGNAISFTQAMTLDASGQLVIGATSATSVLDVVGPGNPTVTIRGTAGGYTGILNIQGAGGGGSVITATGGANSLAFNTNNTERARIDSSGNFSIGTTGTGGGVLTVGGGLGPSSDNVSTCANAAIRWSVVYAGTGTINTSDAREKTAVRSLTEAEIAAASQLASEVGAYQWLSSIETKGSAAREHIGMTVQRAIEIMESNGLAPFNYGFICYDEWDDRFVKDEDGNDVLELAAGSRYSFRMDELTLFISRGQQAIINQLKARLDAANL